jgi:hypothetical protein
MILTGFDDDNVIGTDKSDHGDVSSCNVSSCNELIYKYMNKFESETFENGTETRAFDFELFVLEYCFYLRHLFLR